jgi:hypothetical protein
MILLVLLLCEMNLNKTKEKSSEIKSEFAPLPCIQIVVPMQFLLHARIRRAGFLPRKHAFGGHVRGNLSRKMKNREWETQPRLWRRY